MKSKIMSIGILSLLVMTLLAGCTKSSPETSTQPTLPSGNVESSSSSVESATGDFVNDATPTNDQVVPDLPA